MEKVFSRQDQSKQTEQFSHSKDIISVLAKNIGPEFLKYRERFERAVSFQEETAFPIHMDFETIFGCNIRCVMCTHAHRDRFPSRKRLMDMTLFKKIIDEGVARGLASIGLDQEGEPLLVENLVEYIRYAKDKGILDIMINSNALALDKDRAEALLHTGLTRIHFSLDAVNKETYDRIRIGSDFNKVVDNILYFCRRKKELKKELPITRVSFVKMSYNGREMEEFVKFWTPHVDAIAIQEYNNPFPEDNALGLLCANNKIKIKNTDFRCTQPWFRMVVLTDGTVMPCCMLGMSLRMALGNAGTELIRDLWNSKAMKDLRRLHKDGNFAEHKICRICAKNFL